MIKVEINKKQGKIVSYEISGHAMSGDFGHDIVCSAVSVLGITTCNGIENLTDVQPLYEMEDGYLYIEMPTDIDEEQDKVAQILLQNFEFAIKDVIAEYGEFIQFA